MAKIIDANEMAPLSVSGGWTQMFQETCHPCQISLLVGLQRSTHSVLT